MTIFGQMYLHSSREWREGERERNSYQKTGNCSKEIRGREAGISFQKLPSYFFFFFFFFTQNVYIHRSIDPLVYTSINVFIPSIEDYSNVACIIINCNKNFQIMHVFKYAWGINLFSSRIVIVNKRQYLTFIFQVLQVNNKRLKIKIKKRYHVSSSTHLRILKSRRNLT